MRKKSEATMKRIMDYIEKYYFDHYNSPSNTKIAEAVGISRGTVHRYLVEMDERGMLSYTGREIRTNVMLKTDLNENRAAVLGSVACGLPQFAEENIEEYVSLPESLFGKGPFYLLHAKGNSMIGAGIENGDMVVIKSQSEAEEGEIVVALIDNEATLKRFYIDKASKRIRLHPENPEMEDIFIDNCIIQGVAVKVIKDLE